MLEPELSGHPAVNHSDPLEGHVRRRSLDHVTQNGQGIRQFLEFLGSRYRHVRVPSILQRIDDPLYGKHLHITSRLIQDFFVLLSFSYFGQDIRLDQLLQYLTNQTNGNFQSPRNLRGIPGGFSRTEPLHDQFGNKQGKQYPARVAD